MEIGKEQPAIYIEPLTKPAGPPVVTPEPAPVETPATPEREKTPA